MCPYCFWQVHKEENWKNSVMSHRERKESLFETSLKSQDDFCIKYETFKDDINGDAQTIEKVIQK